MATGSKESREYIALLKAKENKIAFKLSITEIREGWEVVENTAADGLAHYGLFVANKTTVEQRFYCCLEGCFEKKHFLKLTTNGTRFITSNCNKHIKSIHKMNTNRSEAARAKIEALDEFRKELREVKDMTRYCELLWTMMVIVMKLPFTFVTSAIVRRLMTATCIEEMNKSLSIPRVKHLICEIYSSVKGSMIAMMNDAVEKNGERIFSLNIDNWKPKNSIRNFVGLRVYFTNGVGDFVSLMLGMREFNPSYALRYHAGQREALCTWVQEVLSSFSLSNDNIFASTTDNAGDVRTLARGDIGCHWEWCPPHLINRALKEAFGPRNPDTMEQLEEMNSLIRKVKDTTKGGTLFNELQQLLDEGTRYKVLKSYQEQRFIGIFKTFERFYELYDTVVQFCAELQIEYTVALSKEEVEQFLSLLQPLKEIVVKSQTQQKAYGYMVLDKVVRLRMEGVLNENVLVNHWKSGESIVRLSSRVRRTRSLLISAIDTRYFKKYFQPKSYAKGGAVYNSAYISETQFYLHPALRSLTFLENIVSFLVEVNSASCKKKLKICERKASRAAKKLGVCANSGETYNRLLYQEKQRLIMNTISSVKATMRENIINCVIKNVEHKMDIDDEIDDDIPPFFQEAEYNLDESSFAELINRTGRCQDNIPERNDTSLYRKVSDELEEYLVSTGSEFTNCDFSKVSIYDWRKKNICRFKYICRAIGAYFGVPSSAGGIECDFSFAKHLLTGERSTLSASFTEMIHMVDRNKHLVDLKTVPILSLQKAKKVQPDITLLPDEDLTACDEPDMEDSEHDEENDDQFHCDSVPNTTCQQSPFSNKAAEKKRPRFVFGRNNNQAHRDSAPKTSSQHPFNENQFAPNTTSQKNPPSNTAADKERPTFVFRSDNQSRRNPAPNTPSQQPLYDNQDTTPGESASAQQIPASGDAAGYYLTPSSHDSQESGSDTTPGDSYNNQLQSPSSHQHDVARKDHETSIRNNKENSTSMNQCQRDASDATASAATGGKVSPYKSSKKTTKTAAKKKPTARKPYGPFVTTRRIKKKSSSSAKKASASSKSESSLSVLPKKRPSTIESIPTKHAKYFHAMTPESDPPESEYDSLGFSDCDMPHLSYSVSVCSVDVDDHSSGYEV